MKILWILGSQRLGSLLRPTPSFLSLSCSTLQGCRTLSCSKQVDQTEAGCKSDSKESSEEANKKKLDELLQNPPTFCCMSGCNNCVWIEYTEKLAKLCKDGGAEAKNMIEKNVSDPGLKAFLMMELKSRL